MRHCRGTTLVSLAKRSHLWGVGADMLIRRHCQVTSKHDVSWNAHERWTLFFVGNLSGITKGLLVRKLACFASARVKRAQCSVLKRTWVLDRFPRVRYFLIWRQLFIVNFCLHCKHEYVSSGFFLQHECNLIYKAHKTIASKNIVIGYIWKSLLKATIINRGSSGGFSSTVHEPKK